MNAAVLAELGDIRVRDWPEQAPVAGEALVRLTRAGICGSDVHLALDGSAAPAFFPIVLGHESAGRVERLGPATVGPAPGTRVAVAPLVTCMRCDRCRAGISVRCNERSCLGVDRHGCFAELVTVPVRNLVPIPEATSDELAAVATDAIATAFHATRTRGGVTTGTRVAVWGSGGLGLCAIGIARVLGAASVIAVDPRPEARARALETGADDAVDPVDAVTRIMRAGGVDVALEFVGSAASVEGAVRSLDHGGRAVVVGLGREHASAGALLPFVLRERELVGSYGAEPAEIGHVLELLASGALSLPRAIGDVIALRDIRSGLERVRRGATGGGRIVVEIS